MDARRRALLMSGGAMALGPLVGCSSLVPDPLVPDLLRNRAYDTSAADASSSAAKPTAPPTLGAQLPLPPLFDDIERRTFDFFWGIGNPVNGLVPDRYPSPVAVQHRGRRLRADGVRDRRRPRLRHARPGPRAHARHGALLPRRAAGPQARGKTGHKGFFYHFLDMKTGARAWPQRAVDRRHRAAARRHAACAGVLRLAATRTRSRSAMRSTRSTGASTGSGRRCAARSSAWAGAPRKASSRTTGAATTRRCWSCCSRSARRPTRSARAPGARGRESYRDAWGRFMGYEHLSFAPLFGHQYSHVWIDFRGIQDATMRQRGIDYFENTRRAVYAQRAYAIANPKGWLRIRRQRLGLHRVRRPGQLRDVRPQRPVPLLPRLLGARRRPRRAPSTTARSRRPPRCRRCRSRPRS